MNHPLEHIHIFKTNLQTEEDVYLLKNMLDAHQEIIQWSVDLHDSDRVLRVISPTLRAQHMVELLARQGYECTELD